jgi:hypothetical protein
MDRRQKLTAALITLCALILLVLISILFKMKGSQAHYPQETHNTVTTDAAPGVTSAPLEPAALAPYEVLVGCELVESSANRGSLIHLKHGDRSFKLRLYYAEAPWLQVGRSEALQDGGTIPELAGEALFDVTEASTGFTLANLRDHTFKVFTRWEKAGDDNTFYGWILLRPGGNDPRYLCELLIANGLASILRSHSEPPAGDLDSAGFMKRLHSLQQVARTTRQGAFAKEGN